MWCDFEYPLSPLPLFISTLLHCSQQHNKVSFRLDIQILWIQQCWISNLQLTSPWSQTQHLYRTEVEFSSSIPTLKSNVTRNDHKQQQRLTLNANLLSPCVQLSRGTDNTDTQVENCDISSYIPYTVLPHHSYCLFLWYACSYLYIHISTTQVRGNVFWHNTLKEKSYC